jgi:hypothetical protein
VTRHPSTGAAPTVILYNTPYGGEAERKPIDTINLQNFENARVFTRSLKIFFPK